MAKYSKAAQKNVESAMKRMEKGTLRSGRSGKKVTNPKQAIAIGLSEARKKGAKVPAKKKTTVKTKTAAKKRSSPKKVIVKKKAVSAEPSRLKKIPAKGSLPPASELSEELVEKSAHTDRASREHIITAGTDRMRKNR